MDHLLVHGPAASAPPAPPPPRRRGLIAFLAAEVVSTTGTRMSMVAVPWFVLVTTGSAALTGLTAFAETLPLVLVMGLGGPVVDRLGARRVAMGADVLSALLVAAVPVLHWCGRLPLGVLVVLVALAGALRGAGSATSVLLPGLAEQARTPIERASGLRDGMNRTAGMVGVPVAGVLMALWSAPVVLMLDAASFVVAAVLIAAFVDPAAEPPRTAPGRGDAGPVAHYVGELRDGAAFLRRDRLLVAIGLLVLVTNLLDQAYGTVLVPVWVRDRLHGPLALGLVGGVFGVGAVVGSILFAWLGPRLPRRRAFAWGFLVGGAPRFLMLAFATTLQPALAVALVAGLGSGSINPVLSSVEFERVPRHLQARVLGTLGAVAWAGMPLGALAGGCAVDAWGVQRTAAILGIVYLVTTLGPVVLPVWAGMERAPCESPGDCSADHGHAAPDPCASGREHRATTS